MQHCYLCVSYLSASRVPTTMVTTKEGLLQEGSDERVLHPDPAPRQQAHLTTHCTTEAAHFVCALVKMRMF
jgi:hypothetical protein